MDKILFKRQVPPKEKKDYTKISNIIRRDKRILPQYKFVFWDIWSQKEGCKLNFTKIANEGGYNLDVLKRAIKQFEEFNYVYRALYSSSTDSAGRINNKYNYYFCDEGRAKEYYLELVESGIINERGTIKKRQVEETSDLLQSIKNKAVTYIETKNLNPIDIVGISDKVEKYIEENYNTAYVQEFKELTYTDSKSIKDSSHRKLKEKNIEKYIDDLIKTNKK